MVAIRHDRGLMIGNATETALYELIVRDLDRMLLSVPKITDAQEWRVIKSRFDLMAERLEFFATTSDDPDRRQTFRNAIAKLTTIQPRSLCA